MKMKEEMQNKRHSTTTSYTYLLIRGVQSGLGHVVVKDRLLIRGIQCCLGQLIVKLSLLISVVQGQLVKRSLRRKERRHEHEGRDTELAIQHNNQLH